MVTVVAGGVIGCGAAGGDTCDSVVTCGRTVQTCCNGSSCYYSLGGTRYPCNGSDCSGAASQVVRAACGAAPGGVAASADVSRLLATSHFLAQTGCPGLP